MCSHLATSLSLGSSPDSLNQDSVAQKMSMSFEMIKSLIADLFFLHDCPRDCALKSVNVIVELLDSFLTQGISIKLSWLTDVERLF